MSCEFMHLLKEEDETVMNKDEFLSRLSEQLAPLDQMERVRMVQYYREIIEDRVEDGLTEEQAVEELEDLDEIAARILDEMGPKPKSQLEPQPQPQPEIVYQPVVQKRRGGFSTVLLVLGFPVWFPLLMAAGAIVLSVYIVAWALVISLYAVVGSLLLAGVAGVIGFFVHMGCHFMSGLFLMGAGFVCAGLGVALLFPICGAVKALIAGSAHFGKWAWNGIFRRGGREA